jgi:hypothetical protein
MFLIGHNGINSLAAILGDNGWCSMGGVIFKIVLNVSKQHSSVLYVVNKLLSSKRSCGVTENIRDCGIQAHSDEVVLARTCIPPRNDQHRA